MTCPTDLIPWPRHSADDREPGERPSPQAEAPAGAVSLLLDARARLREADQADQPGDRFVAAHVAALRAASAVVVARAGQREGKPASVWTLLTAAAPELREWAAYFAARSDRRAAAEAGVPTTTTAEADELLVRSRRFLDVVGHSLLGATR
ncbi:SAV_6107 family HEPN domain-containing protein [Saccharopolyspora griseoalba]|uniref:SAV_6107 family HEPN domain-containing protein n=1 Tax=Saccharopolyspora griseoalba TaxID=1431848 RepID=A0ABW2LS55_9PSEU